MKVLSTSAAFLAHSLFMASSALAADWMQFGYDAMHSGNNTAETALTPDNVDLLQRRYRATLPTSVDGAPVFLSNVSTSGGTRDLLFLLAQNGTLLAVDAADGSVVWSHQESGQQPTTSSPAIDPGRLFVYAYGLDGFVHKYRVGNGNEVTDTDFPQRITLKTDVEKVSGSLTIGTSGTTNYLYVVTSGYVDNEGDFQGHLTTINLSTGVQNVFNTLCSDRTIHFSHSAGSNCGRPLPDDHGGSGIWGRGGATFDAGTNRVYITTGNGWFDANSSGFDWGDSVLSLIPAGTQSAGGGLPDDSYTPANFLDLFDSGTDLGSTSLAILPVPASEAVTHLGAQIGKDAQIRLIDLDNMNGSSIPGDTGGELEIKAVPQGGDGMSEQPVVWVDPQNVTWLLIANNAGTSALKVNYTNLHTPTLETRWQHSGTAKSGLVANGVFYYAASCTGGYCLHAVNPVTGANFWTSSDSVGALHWQSPILVNGAIYIADGTHLYRYDRNVDTFTVTPTASAGGTIAPDTPQSVDEGSTTTFTVTPNANFQIGGVTGCGGSLAGHLYTTGAISADCTVAAVFVATGDLVFRNGFDP
ncbi:MAG: PQQ-binding-like beta-propeller repeat protein [Rhodanobacteraceae bacterium]